MAPDREHEGPPPIKITDRRRTFDDAATTPADEAGVEGSPAAGGDDTAIHKRASSQINARSSLLSTGRKERTSPKKKADCVPARQASSH